MKHKKMFLLVATFCLIAFSSAPAQEPIVIGLSAPMTGQYSGYGETFRNAIDIAFDDINDKGGVRGRKLQLRVGDSEGLPTRAKRVAREFGRDAGILAVIGDFTSSCSMAARPIYQRNNLVQLSPTASHPAYALGSPYSFGIVGTQDSESIFMARAAVETLEKKKIAVVYINNDWGVAAQKFFVEEARRLGAEVVAAEPYLEQETDFSNIMNRIRDAEPELLYICSMYQDGVALMKQKQEMGWDNLTVVGPSSLHSPKLLEMGGDAVNGLILGTKFFAGNPKPGVQQFVDTYRQRYSQTPDQFAALAYDSAVLLAGAIEKAGTDRTAVRDALASLEAFSGVTGDAEFREYGDARRSATLLQVKDGQFILYTAG